MGTTDNENDNFRDQGVALALLIKQFMEAIVSYSYQKLFFTSTKKLPDKYCTVQTVLVRESDN